jgi:hypothetical protein
MTALVSMTASVDVDTTSAEPMIEPSCAPLAARATELSKSMFTGCGTGTAVGRICSSSPRCVGISRVRAAGFAEQVLGFCRRLRKG